METINLLLSIASYRAQFIRKYWKKFPVNASGNRCVQRNKHVLFNIGQWMSGKKYPIANIYVNIYKAEKQFWKMPGSEDSVYESPTAKFCTYQEGGGG